MPIKTIESLRQHLQWAIEIEHATIPPYLTALYSLKAGHNQIVHEVIESIFMEEMLHMTLAANVLNAIGGKPVLDKPDFIAQYPSYLPHSNEAFLVHLGKFSPDALEVFLKIEKPEPHGALPEDDNYHTIGQFYVAIEEALKQLCDELGEDKVFSGNPKRQIRSDKTYYGGSGEIIAVTDLQSALEALEEIIEQGEGIKVEQVWDGDKNMFHPEQDEVAHYFRYMEIKHGRQYKRGDTPESGPTGDTFEVDWDAIYPMRPNPRLGDFPEDSEAHQKMELFCITYSSILRMLHHAFNGQPEFLSLATGSMYELKHQAIELMQMPTGDGETTIGTPFQYIPHEKPHTEKRIVVMKDGPYLIYGNIPLVQKAHIMSEHGEPLTWHKTGDIETEETYALCRCGQSSIKPFCDGTHARIKFEGKETAKTNTTQERQNVYTGRGIVVKRDSHLCNESGFCGDRFRKILDMMPETDDTGIRARVMAMIERCPSGSYTFKLSAKDEADVERSLPQEIAVTTEGEYAGALWVTGEIPVERADGEPFETRNRVTLCRCGVSKTKPLCDGTHREINFSEE